MSVVIAPDLQVNPDRYKLVDRMQNYMDKEHQKKTDYEKLAMDALKAAPWDASWARGYQDLAQNTPGSYYNAAGQSYTQDVFNQLPNAPTTMALRQKQLRSQAAQNNINASLFNNYMMIEKDKADKQAGNEGLSQEQIQEIVADQNHKLDFLSALSQMTRQIQPATHGSPPQTIPPINVTVPGTPPLQPKGPPNQPLHVTSPNWLGLLLDKLAQQTPPTQ